MSYNLKFWNLIECDPGFRGDNCSKKCPYGYYGKNCLNKCNCNDTQICHHVCGCLQTSITTDNITTKNTEVVSSYSVETCFSSIDTSFDSTGLYIVWWWWWWWWWWWCLEKIIVTNASFFSNWVSFWDNTGHCIYWSNFRTLHFYFLKI